MTPFLKLLLALLLLSANAWRLDFDSADEVWATIMEVLK